MTTTPNTPGDEGDDMSSKNEQSEPATLSCGALPPYTVTHIDGDYLGIGGGHRWHVMGTVDGNPRNPCGPVAICEYEPSAHVIAGLLNEHDGTWTREHIVSDTEKCWCNPTVVTVPGASS